MTVSKSQQYRPATTRERWNFYWYMALLICSCGVEVGNPKDPDTGTPPVQNVWIEDDEASEAGVTAQVDEAFFALSESSESESNTNLTSAAGSAMFLLQGFERNLSCTELSPVAIQTEVQLSGQQEVSFGRAGNRLSAMVSYDDSFSTTFATEDQEAVACNESGTLPVITFRRVTQLTTTTDFSRSRSRTITRESDNRVVKSGSFNSSGSRTRVITKTNPVNPLIVRQEISSQFSREAEISTRRSGTITYKSSLVIEPDNPLTITTSYRAGLWTVKQVTVKNYRSTLDNGTVITMDFDNLMFSRSQGCVPTGGLISGRITDSEAMGTGRTFAIDFATEDEPRLIFDNASAYSFTPDFCAFGDD